MNLSMEMEKNKNYDFFKQRELYNQREVYNQKELINSLQDLNEIQKNLASIVNSQQNKIDTIESNILHTEKTSINSLQEIQTADKLYFSYKPIILGGILGAVVGGPVGVVVGLNWLGGLSTFVGGLTGYKLQKF
jgi:hypothetical protein